VRLSYELPYPNNKIAVKLPTLYGGGDCWWWRSIGDAHRDGLQLAGQEQGMNIFERASIATGTTITNSISQEPAPPSALQMRGGLAARRGARKMYRARCAGCDQSIPGRLDEYKWWLVGGLIVSFRCGIVVEETNFVTVAGADPLAQQSAEKPQAAARHNCENPRDTSPSTNGIRCRA